MKIIFKLSILGDQGQTLIGKGGGQLLLGIKRLGSISQAAKEMDMSYVKALKIIKKMENNLGQKILITRSGGNDRGGAELTPLANELLELFIDYEESVSAFAKEKFDEQFDKINESLDRMMRKRNDSSG